MCVFMLTRVSVHADCTCMYGPVSEERSIFLHIPSVSRGVHPWNLEYSLLLQAKNMQNMSRTKTHPACVHFKMTKHFTSNSIVLVAIIVLKKSML